MKEMATNSAAGPDHFAAVLLKRCTKELSVPLLSLYTFSLESVLIPKQLKSANIVPIRKGWSKREAKNYRPVAFNLPHYQSLGENNC